MAVAYLEPHMARDDQGGKGTIVLATVKGDVHDIGKNLVDIIFTNNGYEVVNLGIKVGIGEMITAAEERRADAIGMSGLLVKSTLIMRDNLEELNDRRLAHIPVLLGGAALTRTYVERDLRTVYTGRVFYGRDAFEGLRTMERLMEIKGGLEDPDFGREISERKVPARSGLTVKPRPENVPDRSPEVATDNPVFPPPFLGSRVAKGIPLDEIANYLNLTSLFRNQWGFRPDKANQETDPEFKERVSVVLREQLAKAKEADLLIPQVVWGHFPANSEGDDLVVYEDERRDHEIMRFTFPRQPKEPWLCIADFFRSSGSGEQDWASFQLVTMGRQVSEEAAKLFAANEYQNYLFLHGLGVEMTEALAEYWHRRIREELGFADEDGPSLTGLFRQQYRGGRYSWGYPACPDLADNAKVVELLGGGAHRRGHERELPAGARTNHRRHHLLAPGGQVLHRVTRPGCAPRWARNRDIPVFPGSGRYRSVRGNALENCSGRLGQQQQDAGSFDSGGRGHPPRHHPRPVQAQQQAGEGGSGWTRSRPALGGLVLQRRGNAPRARRHGRSGLRWAGAVRPVRGIRRRDGPEPVRRGTSAPAPAGTSGADHPASGHAGQLDARSGRRPRHAALLGRHELDPARGQAELNH